MNQKILFIHIPKTAGTSFRLAARKYFGGENTYYDYGVEAKETSALVRRFCYDARDIDSLKQALSKHDQLFFGGHVKANKYAQVFEAQSTIAFVRKPVEQVLSHYKHYVTLRGYQGDLSTFIEDRRFQNVQSRMLAGRDLEDYGFIGLTESYSTSIELINARYHIELDTLKLNVRTIRKFSRKNVDPRLIDLIERVNRKDVLLYEKANDIFTRRLELFRKG